MVDFGKNVCIFIGRTRNKATNQEILKESERKRRRNQTSRRSAEQ